MKRNKFNFGSNLKNSIIHYLAIFGCCIAVLTLAFTTQTFAQNEKDDDQRSDDLKIEIVPVHPFGSTAVLPQAGASLSRNRDGVLGTISTSGLTPGHVMTFWWAIFNNSRFCATPVCAPSDLNNPLVNSSLQYGGGTIADAGGRVNFTGYLARGDNTGFYLIPTLPNMPNPAPGIVITQKAQIHLVIRTHGVADADPTILNQQLTTFTGGCSINPCANVQAAPFLNN